MTYEQRKDLLRARSAIDALLAEDNAKPARRRSSLKADAEYSVNSGTWRKPRSLKGKKAK